MVTTGQPHDLYNLVSMIDPDIKSALQSDQSLSLLLRTDPLSPHELQTISVSVQNSLPSPTIGPSVQILLNGQHCISILDSEYLSLKSVKGFVKSFESIKMADQNFSGTDGMTLFVGKCCELAFSTENPQEIASALEGLRYAKASNLYEGIESMIESVVQEFEAALLTNFTFETAEELDGYLEAISQVKNMEFTIEPETFEIACYGAIENLSNEK